jgi:hypothetical protein
MIKVSVLYPNKPGSHFDMNYYVGKHMPLAMRLLNKGLRKTEVDAGIQGITRLFSVFVVPLHPEGSTPVLISSLRRYV